MYRAGKHGFAGAAFADDQHGRAARGDGVGEVVHTLHRHVAADQTQIVIRLRLGRFVAECFLFDRFLDRPPDDVVDDRLGQIIGRAQASRFDRGFDRAVPGQHDDGGARESAFQIAQNAGRLFAAKLQIGQQDVDRRIFELLVGVREIVGSDDFESVPPQQGGQRMRDDAILVQDEDLPARGWYSRWHAERPPNAFIGYRRGWVYHFL